MRLKIKKRYISALISIFLLYMIFQKMDFAEILENLQGFNLKGLFLAIPLYFTGYIARAKRWKSLMLNNNILQTKTLMGIIFTGYAMNCFMPARAGDFFRAHLIGDRFGLSKVKVISSILLERILDGIVVFSMLVFVMLFFCKQPWIYDIATLAGSIFLGLFAILFYIIKSGKLEDFLRKLSVICRKLGLPQKIVHSVRKAIKHVVSFLEGFDVLKEPKLLVQSFTLTGVMWAIECVFLFIIINCFGVSLPPAAAVFLLCLTVFAAMVPSTSIHAGPYQAAFILALSAFAVPQEMAIAMAFVTQGIMITFLTVSGVFYFIRYYSKIKQIKEEFDKTEDLIEESNKNSDDNLEEQII